MPHSFTLENKTKIVTKNRSLRDPRGRTGFPGSQLKLCWAQPNLMKSAIFLLRAGGSVRLWDGEGARPLGGLSLGRPQETGRFSPSILRVGVFPEEVGLPGEGAPPYPPQQEKGPSTVSRMLPLPPSLASCRQPDLHILSTSLKYGPCPAGPSGPTRVDQPHTDVRMQREARDPLG